MKADRNFYRIMLGPKSKHAEQCRQADFIGADWGIDIDLTGRLPEDWREFNRNFIPVFLEKNPGKSKVAAGLACGMLHTICKGIKKGDIVLCPSGTGLYHVGEVISEYFYAPDEVLPHRRSVSWRPELIDRDEMSQSLKYSTGSVGTVSNITRYAEEIEKLLGNMPGIELIPADPDVEDPIAFALEKHLEEFLVHNWPLTELGKKYDIFEDDGEKAGRQYPTDTGNIDILAVSKDKKELLVVELKKGRASDVVVGQIQRYMGYVLDELAEKNQQVKGVIIAMEDDIRLQRALRVASNIEFFRYQVSFKLKKA